MSDDHQTLFEVLYRLHKWVPSLELLDDSLAEQILFLRNHKSAHVRGGAALFLE